MGKKRIVFQHTPKMISNIVSTICDAAYILDSEFPDAAEVFKESKKSDFKSKVLNYLANAQEEFEKENSEPSKFEEFASNNKLIPFVDVRNADVILWDSERNKIAETTYRAFKVIHGAKIISAMQVEGFFKPAYLDYDPIDLSLYQTTNIDGVEAVKLNTYRPPKWRLEDYEAKIAPEYEEFFEFLFPVEKERSLIYTFLKHAILYRVSHMLVLLGGKGVGKNIFVEEILTHLVGREYFAKPAKNFFKGGFQDVLENNRLLFIDEIKATNDEAKKDLKRLPNAWQGIEKKRQDTQQQRIFYSVVIANNSLDDIYIEFDDRRFFIPEIGKDKLRLTWGKDKIRKYVDIFRNKKNIAELGNWLIQREDDPDFNEEDAFITDTFHKAVSVNLRGWQSFVVENVLEAKERYLDWKELKKKNIKDNGKDADKFLKPKKVKDFLDDYLHEGKHFLGEWVKYEGKFKIKVNTDLVALPEPSSDDANLDNLIDSL